MTGYRHDEPGRADTNPTTDLHAGDDFRQPDRRREVFHRFYEYHLRYRDHPGCVYYVIPYLRERMGWDEEQTLWFAFLNGNTQNPVTSLILHRRFPTIGQAAEMVEWFGGVYPYLQFDTDRRHHKPHLPDAVASYTEAIGRRTQQQYWEDAAEQGWAEVWRRARNIKTFGRLSAFSYAEYLRICGVPFDCGDLFLEDIPGSRSHRNGLAKVLGRDDLDWHESNPTFDGKYTPEMIEWFTDEAARLLAEARARHAGTPHETDVSYFTLESTLCTYKSWHRPNRRYPNVYSDMLHDRLCEAGKAWGPDDTDPLWEARDRALPPHLRLEDTPADPGCVPAKQNHYLRTGQVIMMHREWPCFRNDFNDTVDAADERAR